MEKINKSNKSNQYSDEEVQLILQEQKDLEIRDDLINESIKEIQREEEEELNWGKKISEGIADEKIKPLVKVNVVEEKINHNFDQRDDRSQHEEEVDDEYDHQNNYLSDEIDYSEDGVYEEMIGFAEEIAEYNLNQQLIAKEEEELNKTSEEIEEDALLEMYCELEEDKNFIESINKNDEFNERNNPFFID